MDTLGVEREVIGGGREGGFRGGRDALGGGREALEGGIWGEGGRL